MEKMTRKSDIARLMAAYERLHRSSATELYDVYSSYSCAKVRALNYCKELKAKYNGFNGRILGSNSMTFSYGFEFVDENGALNFAYITRDYDRYCEVQ